MTVRLAAFVTAAVLVAPPPMSGQASADDDAVRSVVATYPHGLKFNDVASLKKVFWPDAKLFWVKGGGTIGQLTQSDWYTGFPASPGKEGAGDLRVVSVDVSGDVASAKVEEKYPNSVYVDYVSLLKVSGRWWIVNKVYTSHPR